MATGRFSLPLPAYSEYVRPADWLQIDHLVTDGSQKAVFLFAVFPSSNTDGYTNACAINVAANYTVDWGDGSAAENVSSGVTAQHIFDYNNVSNLTSRGYRQAIVTITPQSGQNITSLNFAKAHSSIVQKRYVHQILDCRISGTLITRVMFYDLTQCAMMEKCRVYQASNAATSCASMFVYCTSLQSLNLSSFNTASVTNMSSMFAYCYSLQSLNLSSFNTASVTNMDSMFVNSRLIKSINLSGTNLNSVTSMSTILPTTVSALTECRLPNVPLSFSIAGNSMSADALNALFGDLKDRSATTSQTITITGNPGSATCNQSIATAKNWVVVN